MKRRNLLAFLVILTVVTTTGFSLWSAQVFAASRALNGDSQVLGAEHQTGNSLLPYPIVSAAQPVINARSYALYNIESGKVLVSHNGDQQVPIASTTKLMTAYLVIKYGTLTDSTVASQFAIEAGGSVMGLQKGEQMTIHELLYGLLLPSGNDAAHTLAEYVGRKLLNTGQASAEDATARFVQEMNSEATRLNLLHTHFMDPAGLDDTGYSSAIDLAKLMSVVAQDSTLYAIATTPTYVAHNVSGTISHPIQDSNRLITEFAYEGAGIGKTGFTPAAGHCLVATASRNHVTYVAVILSTYNTAADASAVAARQLLDWGFNSVTYAMPGATTSPNFATVTQ